MTGVQTCALPIFERIARAKYRGNTWSAWSDGTPMQMQLVDAILDYPGHIIATMRSKTEWAVESENGKTKPTRVGLAPEQGKGIEYEFDLLMELTTDHTASIIKDRTGKFQDTIISLPGEDLGKELAAWLNEGDPAPKRERKQAKKEPAPTNGNAPAPDADGTNPDIEALTWTEFAEAAVRDLGYGHAKHAAAAARQELGDDYAKTHTKTAVWAALAAHQAAKAEAA